MFGINTMSVSDSCESCASSHYLRAVRTCDARCRRVVCAYSSCVILACRVPFARVVTRRVRASSRDDHVCRAASARDNKLFSLINTHVNNVNSSGHIF